MQALKGLQERRKIAEAQGWRCADPDGGCLLPGELQEFDVDHVTPIWKGGLDEPENMQALCPACHWRKTNRERLERSMVQEEREREEERERKERTAATPGW